MRHSRRQILGWAGALAGASLTGCTAKTSTNEPETTPEATSSPVPLTADGIFGAPGLPAPKFAETNGIRMGYYDTGAGSQSTPVVFCHGFPELAFSWRHQLSAFGQAGYRAIAPDQRGYGLTTRPDGFENYTLKHLTDDMAGLLDALEIDKAVFVGHDWGGGVVWMMPRVHPDRVAGVIGVNTPGSDMRNPRRNRNELINYTDRYYVSTFQPPGYAESILESDPERALSFMLRRGGLWNREAFAALPEDSDERKLDLLALIEKGNFSGEVVPNEEDFAYFVDTFSKTGFTGGLNWYRAAAQSESDWQGELAWDIEVPSLYIGAEDDVVLPPSSADGMEDFINDFEKHTIADCGHWTQQEKPEEFNRLALDWLGRKFA